MGRNPPVAFANKTIMTWPIATGHRPSSSTKAKNRANKAKDVEEKAPEEEEDEDDENDVKKLNELMAEKRDELKFYKDKLAAKPGHRL